MKKSLREVDAEQTRSIPKQEKTGSAAGCSENWETLEYELKLRSEKIQLRSVGKLSESGAEVSQYVVFLNGKKKL